jgi:hypothetical protein
METILSAPAELGQLTTAVLVKLQKAFSTGTPADQLCAIASVPLDLDENPFPDHISQVLNKLAEFFPKTYVVNKFVLRARANLLTTSYIYGRTNEARLYIYKAFEKSEKHCEKGINVERGIREIFSILENRSTDPVARSYSLRLMSMTFAWNKRPTIPRKFT